MCLTLNYRDACSDTRYTYDTLAFVNARAARKILAVRGNLKIAPGGKCLRL